MTAAEYFDVALLDSDVCDGTTGTFRFARPRGYRFRPGQFFTLGLETSGGYEEHYFSHAAAPGDPHIEITTRLTGSPFKDALLGLEPDVPVAASGAAGRFGLSDPDQPAAFLVGGVGVTPAMSIVRDAARSGRPLDAVLFFGNPSSRCMPYATELTSLVSAVPGLRLVTVLEHARPGDEAESGLITAELVRAHVDDIAGRLWLVSGPPAMVAAMRAVAEALGVERGSLIAESFTGYR